MAFEVASLLHAIMLARCYCIYLFQAAIKHLVPTSLPSQCHKICANDDALASQLS